MAFQYFDSCIRHFLGVVGVATIFLLEPVSTITCQSWCLENKAGNGRFYGPDKKNNRDVCAQESSWYNIDTFWQCVDYKNDEWHECTKKCSSHCAGHCADGGVGGVATSMSDYKAQNDLCSTGRGIAEAGNSTSNPYCCCEYTKDDPMAYLKKENPVDSCESKCNMMAAGSGELKKGSAPLCAADCATQCSASSHCEKATKDSHSDFKATSDCNVAESQACCCTYPRLHTFARLRLLMNSTSCKSWEGGLDGYVPEAQYVEITSGKCPAANHISITSRVDCADGYNKLKSGTIGTPPGYCSNSSSGGNTPVGCFINDAILKFNSVCPFDGDCSANNKGICRKDRARRCTEHYPKCHTSGDCVIASKATCSSDCNWAQATGPAVVPDTSYNYIAGNDGAGQHCTMDYEPGSASTIVDTPFALGIYSNADFRNGACHRVQSSVASNASIVKWTASLIPTPGSYKIVCLSDGMEEFRFYSTGDCSGGPSANFLMNADKKAQFFLGQCVETSGGTFGQVQLDMDNFPSWTASFRTGCEATSSGSDMMPFTSPEHLYVNMFNRFGGNSASSLQASTAIFVTVISLFVHGLFSF